jgi:hypothetical protein
MDYKSPKYKKFDDIATIAVDIGTFLIACGTHTE